MIGTIAKWKINLFNLREGNNYPDFCGAKTMFKRKICLNLAPKLAVPGSNLNPEACMDCLESKPSMTLRNDVK
jgi:hypothetical protein